MPPLLTDVFQSPDLDMSNISGGWFRKWLKSIRRILLLIHANSIACWSSLSLCCGINHGTGDSPVWWKFNVSMLASIREPRQKKIHPYRPYMSISHIFLYLFASDHIHMGWLWWSEARDLEDLDWDLEDLECLDESGDFSWCLDDSPQVNIQKTMEYHHF